jgi:glycosyltransferase involved in cell wall biosynthesis
MNICIIASGYPSKSKPVLDIFIHEQAREMIRQGLKINVITIGNNNDSFNEKIDGVNIHRIPCENFKSSNLLLLIFCLKALIIAFRLNRRTRFDIIHSHFADHAGLAGVLISKLLKKPFVLTSHGYDIYYNKKIGYGYGNKLPSRFLLRFIFKIPNRITVASKSLKNQLKKFNIDSRKIQIIHNGINLDFINEDNNKNKIKKSFVILTVANLLPIKNIGYMIEAMPYILEKIPEAKYIVVGEGPDRKNLEKIIEKRKLSNNVILVGELSNNDLKNYYSIADVFVLPSIHEGFGIVKLEAFAFSIPVIVTDGGGIVEGIEDGKNGFIIPLRQPKKLANAVITILAKPELKKKMGQKGKETLMKKFLWEYNVKKIIHVYQGLL